jgi:hypothetical protein
MLQYPETVAVITVMQYSSRVKTVRSDTIKCPRRKKLWAVWARAIGEKAHNDEKTADQVALVRTAIFISYFTTNCFIMAGVIRHWSHIN